MKTLLLIIMAVAFASPAMASQFKQAAFAMLSSASGGIKYSASQQVQGYATKSVTVSGVNLNSSPSSIVYKNMSGTLVAQCAPTGSGPWSTCSQYQASGGAAVSLTSNGYISWQDSVAYIRIKWTATANAVGQKVKAWLNWQE